MAHWYVYHSQNTMKRPYAALAEPVVYSKKQRRKLCRGDWIWVIEGTTDQPTRYHLADCFRQAVEDDPPFSYKALGFVREFKGERSLLVEPVALERNWPWVDRLHRELITKQGFFRALHDYPDVVKGLLSVAKLVDE